jgi:hypothetical protein
MENFYVGERVWLNLEGKRRLTKIRSFVPDLMGGVLCTVIVEGKEYAVGRESLTKTNQKKKQL